MKDKKIIISVLQQYLRGDRTQDIVNQNNISLATLHVWVKKSGIKMRPALPMTINWKEIKKHLK